MSDELARITQHGTDADFLKLYNRLCVAFRELPDDTGVTQEVYFSALRDLPLIALAKGADALMRDTSMRFFPRVTDWREKAEHAYRTSFEKAVQPSRDEAWHYECEACEDTGWNRYQCSGDSRCGRRFDHATHEYVTPCTCRPMNHTYQRHNTFGKTAGE